MINGESRSYDHRLAPNTITHLVIKGDIDLPAVSYGVPNVIYKIIKY